MKCQTFMNDRIHVGLNESKEITCKECIKKAAEDEKFMSSTVGKGLGDVVCVACMCVLN